MPKFEFSVRTSEHGPPEVDIEADHAVADSNGYLRLTTGMAFDTAVFAPGKWIYFRCKSLEAKGAKE